MRVSWGFDAHQFGGPPPLLLAGVVVDENRGVYATSDGDVVAHAVADALLGACGLGDMGSHFPSSDERWTGANSLDLLARVLEMCAGAVIEYVDVTVIAEAIPVAPHRQAIRDNLAKVLAIDPDLIAVKATSTDGMGFMGRDEGLAAAALVTVEA